VSKKEKPATLVLIFRERLPVALIHNKDGMVEVDSQGIFQVFEMWPTNDKR
jgi:cell division septal protein FtsQ